MRTALAIAVAAASGGGAVRGPAQVVLAAQPWACPVLPPTVPGPGYDLAPVGPGRRRLRAALDIAEREYRGSTKIGADRWIDSIASATVLGECLLETGRLSRGDGPLRGGARALGRPRQLAARGAVSAAGSHAAAAAPSWPPGAAASATPLPPLIPDTMTIRQQGGRPAGRAPAGRRAHRPLRSPDPAPGGHPVARDRDLSHRLAARRPRPRTIRLDQATRSALPPARPAQPLLAVVDRHRAGHGLLGPGQGPAGAAAAGARAAGGQPARPSADRLGADRVRADRPRRRPRGRSGRNSSRKPPTPPPTTATPAALEEAFHGPGRPAAARRGATRRARRIRLAVDATRRGPAALRARLLAMQAESAGGRRRPAGRAGGLEAIDGRLLNGEAGQGTLGGDGRLCRRRWSPTPAGDVAGGDDALERPLAIARSRSPRLFQTGLLAELVRAGSSTVSERQADDWFAKLAGRSDRRGSLRPTRLDAAGRVIAASRRRGLRHLGGGGRPAGQRRSLVARRGDDAAPLDRRPAAGRQTGGDGAVSVDRPAAPRAAEAGPPRGLVDGQPGLDALLTRFASRGATSAASASPPAPAGLSAGRARTSGRTTPAAAADSGRSIGGWLPAGQAARAALPAPHAHRRDPPPARAGPGPALLPLDGLGTVRRRSRLGDRLVAWQVKQATGLPRRDPRPCAKELSLRRTGSRGRHRPAGRGRLGGLGRPPRADAVRKLAGRVAGRRDR